MATNDLTLDFRVLTTGTTLGTMTKPQAEAEGLGGPWCLTGSSQELLGVGSERLVVCVKKLLETVSRTKEAMKGVNCFGQAKKEHSKLDSVVCHS